MARHKLKDKDSSISMDKNSFELKRTIEQKKENVINKKNKIKEKRKLNDDGDSWMRILVTLPKEKGIQLEESANKNCRSLSNEIVYRITNSMREKVDEFSVMNKMLDRLYESSVEGKMNSKRRICKKNEKH